MLKNFFISLLGTIAGLWISLGLMFLAGLLFVVIAAASIDGEEVEIKKNTVLYLGLGGELTERREMPDYMDKMLGSSVSGIALNEIVQSIMAATDDERVSALFIECGGALAGTASRAEILQAVEHFRASGKPVIAYSDSYSQGDYYIASAADEVFLNPIGGVDIHGLAMTTTMFKNLLDKAGVDVQIVKVGTYKSAVEPYMLTEISDANREQQTLFVTRIWDNIAGTIAANRGASLEDVNQWADSLIVTEDPDSYTGRNIVTGLKYRYEALDFLAEKIGEDKADDINFVSVENYYNAADMLHSGSSECNIAVLYAVGDIVDSGRGGIVGPTVVKQIEELIDDESVDGLVLRVNSGGGSAFASEQIWEALERFKATERPLYVSMGDYAASGGYYISCGADIIFADPTTLTGSIGIFAMIPCVKGLLTDKIGIDQSTVMTNPNANFISLTQPLNSTQRRMMQREVNRGYELFVRRCADGRNMPADSIKAIAEGRIWDGATAVNIGLVDQLGTLDDAITEMAVNLGSGRKYTVTEYPKLKLGFWEQLEALDYNNLKSYVMRRELGEQYRMMMQAEQLKKAAPIQARMEYMTVQQ